MENQPTGINCCAISSALSFHEQPDIEALFDFSSDVICTIDRDGRFVQVSAASKMVWGYTPEELKGTCYMDLVVEHDRERTQQAANSLMNGVNLKNFLNHYKCKDGSIKPIIWSAKWTSRSEVMYCIAKDRTETDSIFKASQKKLETIVESIGDGFFALNRNWTVIYWNNKAEQATHIKRENVLGKSFWDLYPKGKMLKFYSEFQRAILENVPVNFEEFSPTHKIWMQVYAYPSEEGLSVFIRDCTERKRHEQERRLFTEKIKQVNENLQNVLESMSDGFYTVDPSWNITFATDKVATMLGLNKQEYIGKNLWQSFPEAASSKFYSEYHRAFAENTLVSFEEFLSTFNMWFEVNAYPNKNGLSVYVKDVTHRKRQEKRLEFIAKATSEVIWERSFDSEYAFINGERFKQLFGYDVPSNTLPFSSWLEKVHPEDLPAAQENCKYTLDHGFDFFWREYRFRKIDGSWAYVKERVYIVRDYQNKPVAMIGAMEDVTSERLTDKALAESEKSYRQLFNNAPLPNVIYDTETLRILDVNSTAIEHYGYSREEFLSMTALDIRPKEEYPKLFSVLSNLELNKRKDAGTFVHLKKSGEKILVEVTLTTINYKGRKANLATIKNVTEKSKLREELIRERINQQKNITKVAIETQENERSEISKELHDNVNQLLATAKLYVENIKYHPEQSRLFVDKGTSLLNKSIDEIRRLSSALVTPTIRDVGFKDTLLEMVGSYQELKIFAINYAFDFDDKGIDNGIKLSIYRILQEQFNNTVKYAKATAVQVEIKQNKNTLQLIYQDNGIGFNPSKVKKGLGLRNIKNRTDAYRGKVQLKSSVGNGCRMKITFPMDTANSTI